MRHTYEYAQMLSQTVSPASLRVTKRQIYAEQQPGVGVAQAVRDAARLLGALMKEPDYKEGVKALLEKRLPQWQQAEEGMEVRGNKSRL